MKCHFYVLVLTTILSAVFGTACGPTPATETDEDIQDVRVQVVEPEKTTSKVEQFPLPNCGGNDKLVQSLGTYASISKSASVDTTATIIGGGETQIPATTKLKLEIQVELAYQSAFESANSRVDSIEMSALGGSHIVYTILWEEQTFNSIVQYSSEGEVYAVPYTYQLSIPKIDTSYSVECPPSNDDGENPAPSPIPPLITIEPTSVTLPTLPPDDGAVNLLFNGDFEAGINAGQWEWGGSVFEEPGRDSNIAICSLQTLSADQTVGWIGIAQYVDVIGGQGYSFTGWLNWSNAAQVHMKILWLDSGLGEIRADFVVDGTDGNSGGWVQRGGTAVAPIEAAKARLIIWHGVINGTTNVPNSKLCIDDVVFSKH